MFALDILSCNVNKYKTLAPCTVAQIPVQIQVVSHGLDPLSSLYPSSSVQAKVIKHIPIWV